MSCGCSTSCCCANDCCPEVVPVTVNENTYTLSDNAIDLTVTAVNATTKTLGIQIQDSDGNAITGNYPLTIRFVDTDDAKADLTVVPPATPGASQLSTITDDDGSKDISVVNATLDTWYAVVILGGVLAISDAITVGV